MCHSKLQNVSTEALSDFGRYSLTCQRQRGILLAATYLPPEETPEGTQSGFQGNIEKAQAKGAADNAEPIYACQFSGSASHRQ